MSGNLPVGLADVPRRCCEEDPQGAWTPMRDIVIGIAFLAMLLSPALVASFHKNKNDDEA